MDERLVANWRKIAVPFFRDIDPFVARNPSMLAISTRMEGLGICQAPKDKRSDNEKTL